MMTATHKALRFSCSAAATLAFLATTHCGSPNQAAPESNAPSNAETAQLTVQSAAAQQYFAAANSGNICQAEQDALNKALAALSSNPSGSLDAFNAAMQAFIKCVSAQTSTSLPPVPGQSCTAMEVNGKVQTSGDCSQCKITQSNGGVSVTCSSSSSGSGSDSAGSTSGGGTTSTSTTTTGGGTTTSTSTTTTGGGTTGSLPTDGGTGSSGTACVVTNNNGVITKSGDCSHCTIGSDGSVSCTASN